jgi:hypothetical protein
MASRNNDDDMDDRKAKKKKKKKRSSGPPVLLLMIGGAVLLVLLIVGGGVSAFFYLKAEPAAPKQVEQAKNDEKKEEGKKINIIPKIGEGNPAAKPDNLGVADNVRGAVYRSERRNELANIHKMFTAYELETPKSQRTTQSYLAYIQRDFGPVHEAIVKGYYKINVKVQPGSSEILAGESLIDRPGHFVVRANGMLEHVPADEFKKSLP